MLTTPQIHYAYYICPTVLALKPDNLFWKYLKKELLLFSDFTCVAFANLAEEVCGETTERSAVLFQLSIWLN